MMRLLLFNQPKPRNRKPSFKRLACITNTQKIMPDLTGYISVPDAAQKLDFHVEHVRRLLRQKELVGKKVGYMWFVSEESIKEYSETKKRKTNSEDKE